MSRVEGYQGKDTGLGFSIHTEIYYGEDWLYFLETNAYVSKYESKPRHTMFNFFSYSEYLERILDNWNVLKLS